MNALRQYLCKKCYENSVKTPRNDKNLLPYAEWCGGVLAELEEQGQEERRKCPLCGSLSRHYEVAL